MTFDWVDDFLKSSSKFQRAFGYYNNNYVATHQGKRYLIRVPIPENDCMDLKLIPEKEILKFLEGLGFRAPRLLYAAPSDQYYVHSFIEGVCLNDIYPDHSKLPSWIASDLANQMLQIHSVDPSTFIQYCHDLPASPHTAVFFQKLISSVREIYERFRPDFGKLFSQLCIPDDPFSVLEDIEHLLIPRSFKLCHADIHRKNLIYNQELRKQTILDWELALVADPLYDISVHFHKMRYTNEQENLFLLEYQKYSAFDYPLELYREQISIYRKLENIKSSIVDAVRYTKDLQQSGIDLELQMDYVRRYARKLSPAWEIWGVEDKNLLRNPREILSLLLSA